MKHMNLVLGSFCPAAWNLCLLSYDSSAGEDGQEKACQAPSIQRVVDTLLVMNFPVLRDGLQGTNTTQCPATPWLVVSFFVWLTPPTQGLLVKLQHERR